jgi:hypothetical protein
MNIVFKNILKLRDICYFYGYQQTDDNLNENITEIVKTKKINFSGKMYFIVATVPTILLILTFYSFIKYLLHGETLVLIQIEKYKIVITILLLYFIFYLPLLKYLSKWPVNFDNYFDIESNKQILMGFAFLYFLGTCIFAVLVQKL